MKHRKIEKVHVVMSENQQHRTDYIPKILPPNSNFYNAKFVLCNVT